jgi:hypothetical protein
MGVQLRQCSRANGSDSKSMIRCAINVSIVLNSKKEDLLWLEKNDSRN